MFFGFSLILFLLESLKLNAIIEITLDGRELIDE